MELEDVVHDCLRHLAEVDFTTSATDDFVSLFETTVLPPTLSVAWPL